MFLSIPLATLILEKKRFSQNDSRKTTRAGVYRAGRFSRNIREGQAPAAGAASVAAYPPASATGGPSLGPYPPLAAFAEYPAAKLPRALTPIPPRHRCRQRPFPPCERPCRAPLPCSTLRQLRPRPEPLPPRRSLARS